MKKLKRIKLKTMAKQDAQIVKIDVTYDDGSVQSVGGTSPVNPSDKEVDVLMTDGSTKRFIPA